MGDDKYKKQYTYETGEDPYEDCNGVLSVSSTDYVLWLESKLEETEKIVKDFEEERERRFYDKLING